MKFDKQLVFLTTAVIVVVKSIQPNCDPKNQFRKYCFPVEYCNEFVCDSSNCGHFIINSKLVKIKQTQLIPKCAFSNSPELKYIYGVNSEIQVLASGSFVNLPNLESILLSFNLIRELHHGTFQNVGVSLLDLSWNKIVYVPEGAFAGLTGLKYLNLSRNELKTLPVQDMPPFLLELNLSYNILTMMALKSSRFPNLTKIDISHNVLEGVALLFENPVNKIDLTHNRLSDIDFFDVHDCEELEIPSNYFTKVPEFLTYANIKRVSIYPNPWNCDELSKLWMHLQNNFINVLIDQTLTDGKPICSNADEAHSRLTNVIDDEHDCIKDSHCEDHMICRALKCWEPCQEKACDESSICNATKHRFDCICPGNLKRDPRDVHSPCHDVECFSDDDCRNLEVCSSNKTCISFSYAAAGGSIYYGGSSSFGAGSALSSIGAGPSSYGGYLSSSQAGSSSYGGYPSSFQVGLSSYGGYAPSVQGGSSYYGASIPPSGVAPQSSVYHPVDITTTTVRAEEPWWFYEIPLLAPSNKKSKEL